MRDGNGWQLGYWNWLLGMLYGLILRKYTGIRYGACFGLVAIVLIGNIMHIMIDCYCCRRI